jgi:hypothetical protein
MENQNRTVGSFFNEQTAPNYYAACVMFVTWLNQKYADVSFVDELDIKEIDKIAHSFWILSSSLDRTGKQINYGLAEVGTGSREGVSQARRLG